MPLDCYNFMACFCVASVHIFFFLIIDVHILVCTLTLKNGRARVDSRTRTPSENLTCAMILPFFHKIGSIIKICIFFFLS